MKTYCAARTCPRTCGKRLSRPPGRPSACGSSFMWKRPTFIVRSTSRGGPTGKKRSTGAPMITARKAGIIFTWMVVRKRWWIRSLDALFTSRHEANDVQSDRSQLRFPSLPSRSISLPRFPGGVVLGQQCLRPGAQPGVTIAPLRLNFGNVIVHDAVPATKDGPIRLDLIIPGPERRGLWVRDDYQVAIPLHRADATDLRTFVPSASCFDRLDDLGARLLQAHEQTDNPRTLSAGDGDRLKRSAAARLQRFFIVLLTPGSQLSFYPNLALQDAGDAAVEGLPSLLAMRLRHEAKTRRHRHIAQKFQDIYHAVVVEGDVAMVLVIRGVELWPAAGGILSLKDVGQSPDERLDVHLGSRGLNHPGQKAEFPDRGVVIERAVQVLGIPLVRLGSGIQVFWPAAQRRLVGKYVGRDLFGFGARKPRLRPLGVAWPREMLGSAGTGQPRIGQHPTQCNEKTSVKRGTHS